MKNLGSERLKTMLADECTRAQAIDELGTWAKDTCLLFGCEPSNAFRIAFVLTEGIQASHEGRQPDVHVVR